MLQHNGTSQTAAERVMLKHNLRVLFLHSERSEESWPNGEAGQILRCAQNDAALRMTDCGPCVPQQNLITAWGAAARGRRAEAERLVDAIHGYPGPNLLGQGGLILAGGRFEGPLANRHRVGKTSGFGIGGGQHVELAADPCDRGTARLPGKLDGFAWRCAANRPGKSPVARQDCFGVGEIAVSSTAFR